MGTQPAAAGPAKDSERILALDALRGLGVLGILVMNIESFGRVGAEYVNPEALQPLAGSDYWMWLVSTLFFDEKFMGIFSMLFGAGIVLLTSRIEARGVKPTAIFVRRSAWLALFGLLHAYLLWPGDILFTYGDLRIGGLSISPTRAAPIARHWSARDGDRLRAVNHDRLVHAVLASRSCRFHGASRLAAHAGRNQLRRSTHIAAAGWDKCRSAHRTPRWMKHTRWRSTSSGAPPD